MEQGQNQSALRGHLDVVLLSFNQNWISFVFVGGDVVILRKMVDLYSHCDVSDSDLSLLGGFCCAKYNRDAFNGYYHLCFESKIVSQLHELLNLRLPRS